MDEPAEGDARGVRQEWVDGWKNILLETKGRVDGMWCLLSRDREQAASP